MAPRLAEPGSCVHQKSQNGNLAAGEPLAGIPGSPAAFYQSVKELGLQETGLLASEPGILASGHVAYVVSPLAIETDTLSSGHALCLDAVIVCCGFTTL